MIFYVQFFCLGAPKFFFVSKLETPGGNVDLDDKKNVESYLEGRLDLGSKARMLLEVYVKRRAQRQMVMRFLIFSFRIAPSLFESTHKI